MTLDYSIFAPAPQVNVMQKTGPDCPGCIVCGAYADPATRVCPAHADAAYAPAIRYKYPQGGPVFYVAASDAKTEYTVDLRFRYALCSCPDFHRGQKHDKAYTCKHIGYAQAQLPRLEAELMAQWAAERAAKAVARAARPNCPVCGMDSVPVATGGFQCLSEDRHYFHSSSVAPAPNTSAEAA